MAIDPATAGGIGGILFVISNVAVFWVREWLKHKTWRTNGKDLKEIKAKIDCVDKKVGETKLKMVEIGSAVNAQKEQCAMTVKRFDNAISDQGKELLKIARGK